MPDLCPTTHGAPDPYRAETADEVFARIDMLSHMRQRAAMATDFLAMLRHDVEIGSPPPPGWDWEDIIAPVADAAKALSFEAVERMRAEDAEARRARLIAMGERAGALEKAMQS